MIVVLAEEAEIILPWLIQEVFLKIMMKMEKQT